jgi:hypothetical protein
MEQTMSGIAIAFLKKENNKMRNNLIIGILIFSVILISGCHKKNRPPHTPYTPSGPTVGIINKNYNYSSLAIDPDGDSVALRFNWEDVDTSGWTELVPTGQMVSMSYYWLIADSYYVRAQAKDKKDNISEWSLPHIVKIVANLPPNTPSIPAGPSIGYIDSTYQFFSSGIDPDEDSVLIRFEFGDGDTSEWSFLFNSGGRVSIEYSWSGAGVYLIRAQARDRKGLISNWSEAHLIIVITTTLNHPPDTPSVPDGPSFCFLDSSYSFSSCAYDPDGDYVTIRFDWGDGDTSNWSNFVPGGDSVFMFHSWHGSAHYPRHVRAQAMDTRSYKSDWSDFLIVNLLESALKEERGRIVPARPGN